MSRNSILCISITLNLLIGNAILFLATDSPNYYLMIGMSIACIVSYSLLFNYFSVEKRSTAVLCLASIFTCVIIELIGCFIASTLTALHMQQIGSIKDLFVNIIVGIVMGIFGNIIMFPLTLTLGIGNFFLLLFYVRHRN